MFPTYVGMILSEFSKASLALSVPHVCRDDPKLNAKITANIRCSPRM